MLDSENGSPPGSYDHGEDLTFTVCVPGATAITVSFLSFCTDSADHLRLFDGADTLSPLLGDFSGNALPPDQTATSGCLTFHFRSDGSGNCSGWEAFWTSDLDVPSAPSFLPPPNQSCGTTSLTLSFEEPIPCAAVLPGAFQISGPLSPQVVGAEALNCANGQATEIRLDLAAPLDLNGSYEVQFVQTLEVCETNYKFNTHTAFSVAGCPMNLHLDLNGQPLCQGDSILLEATAAGGLPAYYTFEWNLPGADSNLLWVVLDSALFVEVTLTDGFSTATDSLLLVPQPPPTLPFEDTTLCQSAPPMVLSAQPPGGTWSGPGISQDSLFDPGQLPGGTATLSYTAPGGCRATCTVQVLPLDPGPDEGVCLGAPSFTVLGGEPPGGTWSGPFISPSGVFTPPDSAGAYQVTYTHPNGCSGSKTIFVDELLLPAGDSLCQNDAPILLTAQPPGGTWSGPGISQDSLFDPSQTPGGTLTLSYTLRGCSAELQMHVSTIEAGADLTVCPDQGPFLLPDDWAPVGGVWSGLGIVDASTGLYDPALVPNGYRDTLRLSANGCTDFRVLTVRRTEIQRNDTLGFCQGDTPFALSPEALGLRPPNGSWSGSGVVPTGGGFAFEPAAVPTGLHPLVYDANGCTDTLWVRVHQEPLLTPATFCILDDPVILQTDIPGGTWSGNGIVDATTGHFDPQLAGPGTHSVLYHSPAGCTARTEILVQPNAMINLDAVPDVFCYSSSPVPLPVHPPDALLILDGDTLAAPLFNPAAAGTGMHHLEVFAGQGACADSSSLSFRVGEPLEVSLNLENDSLCLGEVRLLEAEASGGSPGGEYTFQWNQGLGHGPSKRVQPGQTTAYIVTVEDGCSEPARDTARLFVHPPFFVTTSVGEAACPEDSTFAEALAFPGDAYRFEWKTDPPVQGRRLLAPPGRYALIVTDTLTGCSEKAAVELPALPRPTAAFGLLPEEGCLSNLEPFVTVVDSSLAGVRGFWDFGDGSDPIPYEPGALLEHAFPDTGRFLIRLHLESEAGCIAEDSAWVCVLPEDHLFAPNAFTPNGDGTNDHFRLVGLGIESITWWVFDRYGRLLFVGHSLEDAWDGTFQGQPVPQGAYVFHAEYLTLQGPKKLRGMVVVLY